MWLTLVHPSKPFDAKYTLFMAVVFFQFGSCLVLSFIVFALVQYFSVLSFFPYLQFFALYVCWLSIFFFVVWLLLAFLIGDFPPSDWCLCLCFTFQEGS